MKKLFLIVSLLIILYPGCSLLKDLKKPESRAIQVSITGTAATALGQVMVFARDDAGREIVLYKEFYSPFKEKRLMRQEIRRYRKKIARYTNRKVLVTFHTNRAGNKEIDSISR